MNSDWTTFRKLNEYHWAALLMVCGASSGAAEINNLRDEMGWDLASATEIFADLEELGLVAIVGSSPRGVTVTARGRRIAGMVTNVVVGHEFHNWRLSSALPVELNADPEGSNAYHEDRSQPTDEQRLA